MEVLQLTVLRRTGIVFFTVMLVFGMGMIYQALTWELGDRAHEVLRLGFYLSALFTLAFAAALTIRDPRIRVNTISLLGGFLIGLLFAVNAGIAFYQLFM
jgi:high-affinity Fe2+/Pb2+ permease